VQAITFYEAAMKTGRQNVLRFAEQLFQMGNFDKCNRLLREVLETETEPGGWQTFNIHNNLIIIGFIFLFTAVETMREHVSYWMLMSRLHMETSDWEQACRDLLKARQLQLRVISRGAGREGVNVAEEKRLTAL
jgi:hypothetical protein